MKKLRLRRSHSSERNLNTSARAECSSFLSRKSDRPEGEVHRGRKKRRGPPSADGRNLHATVLRYTVGRL